MEEESEDMSGADQINGHGTADLVNVANNNNDKMTNGVDNVEPSVSQDLSVDTVIEKTQSEEPAKAASPVQGNLLFSLSV